MALRRLRVSLPVGLLIAFTVALVAALVAYIHADGRPPTYDDAYYLETGFRLYHRLIKGGLADFINAYTQAFGIRPPLIAVAPLPFFWAFGPTINSALLINAVFLVLANLYLYRLAALWYGPPAGVLSTVIFQTMPITVGMSRAFMTEYGLTALSIAFLYYLIRSRRLSGGAANLGMGVVAGLGLLMKINFLMVLAPLAAVLYFRLRHGHPAPTESSSRLLRLFVRNPLISVLATASLISGTWYAFHLATVVGFTLRISVGAISHYQAASRLIWLRDFIQYAVSTYYAAAFLFAALAVVWIAFRTRRLNLGEREAVLVTWFVPGFLAAAVGSHADFRYTLLVLPPLAIALAASVGHLCRSVLTTPSASTAALAAFLVFPALQYTALTADMPALPNSFRTAGWLIFSKNLGRAHPPDQQGAWGQTRIVETIRKLVPARTAPVNVIVGVEHPYFNANILNYLDARIDGPVRFHSFGFDPDSPPEQALDNALARIRGLNPAAIVTAEGFAPGELQEFINRVNQPVREKLDKGELPFQRAASLDLTPQIKALIYLPAP